ncbi:hypothetical protein HUT06_08135 [Actinomadura sp. NAK00032]|uniref:hypothetical protein n=1 Tax=Actinomadura sp. NAK00032 TaxID=2742128 RepID=UPI001592663E|nr:hypothetical protein [Actinomadura sp. NAK00032]QKW33997.1 hypothetical protein HUT06_08135 [Actinomadura sp. NAK00032]
MVDSTPGVTEYLGMLCPRVTSLLSVCEQGHDRLTTYRLMPAAAAAGRRGVRDPAADRPGVPGGRRTAEHFAGLRDCLLECYPPEYAVFSVFSRTHPALRSMVRRQRLDKLTEDAESGTPFIPSGGVPSGMAGVAGRVRDPAGRRRCPAE